MAQNEKTDGFFAVFYSATPTLAPDLSRLSCILRKEEIAALKNDAVKREKFYVWRLLEHAVKSAAGLDLSTLCPRKTDTGKWVADGICFSLSHSCGALAVCVSDTPCGVDIERLVPPRVANFANKALTKREIAELSALPGTERGLMLTELWSKKESLFKVTGTGALCPKSRDTRDGVRAVRVSVGGELFVLSYDSENLKKATVTEVNLD